MSILGSGKNNRKYRSALRRTPSVYYNRNSVRNKTPKAVNWVGIWITLKFATPIILIIYVLYFSSVFKVKDVIISGNNLVSEDLIKENISTGKNIFSINTQKLESEIESKIPQIEQIKIYKGIPNAFKVVVSEYKGSIVWQTGGRDYLMSPEGIVFEDVTDKMDQYAGLPRVVDNKNLSIVAPSKITTDSFVEFVTAIFTDIKSKDDVDPDYFSVDESTVDLNLATKSGFALKFDTLRQPTKQLDNLKLVLAQKRSEIKEYVDLRISGWVYYK